VKHINIPGLCGLSWPGVYPGDQVCDIDSHVVVYRNNPLIYNQET